ncbi:MAG: transglutaminase-like cysteine peptidase [Pedobacter sp.]|nr:transglutaminase-like cysteine peptidase [Pedobacter sp.]
MAACLMAVLLSACASTTLKPETAKNYTLQRVEPLQSPIESYWMKQGEEAIKAHWLEIDRLMSSSEPKIRAWRDGLEQLRDKPALEQLQQVNVLINGSVPYLGDYQHWSRIDRWGNVSATLLEGGDCEDYAILKAASLLYLGWPSERLSVLIGFSSITRPPGPHAVLMATMEDGAQVILDSAVAGLSLPADNYGFFPAYALTRQALYRVAPLPGHIAPRQISYKIQRPRRLGWSLPSAAEVEQAASLFALPQEAAPHTAEKQPLPL